MAVTDSYVSIPNWGAEKDRAKTAYERSLLKYNYQKDQLSQAQGIRGLGNIQDYLKPGAEVNFDYDPNNPYGAYQQMRGRQGQDITGIEEDAYARGLGGSGAQGEFERQARFAHEGEFQGWKQGVLGSFTDMLMGAGDASQLYQDTTNQLTDEQTRYEAWKRANDPVVAAEAAPITTTPDEPGIANAAVATDVNQARSMLQRASQSGNTAQLAAIFKNTALPEDVRRAADQALKRWRAIRARAVPPREQQGAQRNVRPDPAPGVPHPDPYGR